jgi:hypothetical protein
MPYCNNCGVQNPENSKFCSNCGSSIKLIASKETTQPSPAQTGEWVYSSISGLNKGFFGRENYVMLITQQQLIFVRLKGEEMNVIIQSAREKANTEGKGFFGKISAQLGAHFNMGDYFLNWTPQQVYSRFGEVVSVPLNSINEIRVRAKKDQEDFQDSYELRIKSTGYNEKFVFDRFNKEHRDTLKQVLGSRFKSNTRFFKLR